MNKRIYISLPITGRDINEAKCEAEAMAAKIRENGDIPVSPFEVSPEDGTKDYAAHMGEDITALLRCDEVWFAKNARYSTGCNLELYAASIYGKKILFLDNEDLYAVFFNKEMKIKGFI